MIKLFHEAYIDVALIPEDMRLNSSKRDARTNV
jgi:hypothetical protein